MAWAIQHSVFIPMAQGRRPNHSSSFTPVRFPGSPPLAKPLPETQVHIEGFLFAQQVVAGPRQLVRQSLERQDAVRLALLAIIEALRLRTVAQGEVRRFHKRPGKVLVPVPGVAFTLLLAVTLPQAVHAAAVGTEIAHLRKATDGARLEHDRGRQRVPNARYRLEQAVLRSQAHPLLEPPLQGFDLLPQRLTDSPFIRAPVCRIKMPSIDRIWAVR